MIDPSMMSGAKAGVAEGAKMGVKAGVTPAVVAKAKGAWLPPAEYRAKMAAQRAS